MSSLALDAPEEHCVQDIHPTLEIDRSGLVLSIPPETIELLTSVVSPVVDGDGQIRPERRTESLTHPTLPRPNAGLLSVLAYAALQRGMRLDCIRHSPAPRRLPRPVIVPATRSEAAVLSFVSSRELGLVRYEPGRVRIADQVADIAAAWPDARIAVATGTVEASESLYDQLKAAGVAVTLVTRRTCPDNPARVVVGTFGAMWHHQIEWEKLDFVIVPHATDALLASAQNPLCDPGARFRLVGFLPRHQHLSPRQRDWLVATYGVDELTIVDEGTVMMPPAVVWLPVTINVPEPDDIVTLKRRLVWTQPVRNRRIAAVAKLFAAGDVVGACSQLLNVSDESMNAIRPRCVIVVVENIEHAVAIAERLPGWPIVSALDTDVNGLSDRQRRLFAERRATWAIGGQMIVTTTAAATGTPPTFGSMTVVIWAGGGEYKAPIPESWLVRPVAQADRADGARVDGAPLPLLLIDVADHGPAKIAAWTRQRRDDYLEAGWFAPSLRPELPLIRRWLARRPGGGR